MLDILRDPIWQFMGVFAFICPFIYAYFKRNKKILEYKIISKSKLISVDGSLQNKLSVLFDNKAIHYPILYIMEFANKGNIPIVKSDFDGPIEIVFPRGDIISIDTDQQNTPYINANYKITGSVVSISPFLLNRNNVLSIKLIVDNPGLNVRVQGSIVDGSIVERIDKPRSIFASTNISWMFGVLSGVIMGVTISSITSTVSSSSDYSVKNLVLISLFAMIIYSILFYLSEKFSKIK